MAISFRLLLLAPWLLVSCGLAHQNAPAQAPGAAPAGNSLHNPVFDRDFPDPTIIRVGGRYYAYATQSRVAGRMVNIQVASSTDLQHWQPEGDALPTPPTWATTNFWAPHVLFDKARNRYVLFYSGESTDQHTGKCLGVAFADQPTGPFRDKGTPLACAEGFVDIDPMAFQDPQSGKKYLYWGSGFQPIKVQELTDDWSAFKPGTSPRPVVWPGKDKYYNRLIEGAWVDYYQGKYYLYYSGDNCCGEKANYAVMVARADNPLGPFQRLGESNGTGSSTILEKDSVWLAPGHSSIVEDDRDRRWLAYHAIRRRDPRLEQPIEGDRADRRVLKISPLTYQNGWPVVGR